jgi:hypothetical protein
MVPKAHCLRLFAAQCAPPICTGCTTVTIKPIKVIARLDFACKLSSPVKSL